MIHYFICPESKGTLYIKGDVEKHPVSPSGTPYLVATEEEFNAQNAANQAAMDELIASKVRAFESKNKAKEAAIKSLLDGAGVTDPGQQELLLNLIGGR